MTKGIFFVLLDLKDEKQLLIFNITFKIQQISTHFIKDRMNIEKLFSLYPYILHENSYSESILKTSRYGFHLKIKTRS
jgi:hypothetical protein